jgi:hypothetical protein
LFLNAANNTKPNKQIAGLNANVKAAGTAARLAKANTFTVYVRNSQRVVLDLGGTVADNSLGDEVVANGQVFLDAACAGPAVGTMDLTAITTAILPPANTTERRQMFIEIALEPGVAPNLYAPYAALKAQLLSLLPANNNDATKNTTSTAATFVKALETSGDALVLAGVETYPIGGVISEARPLVLAVTGGTGAFIGASGGVVIEVIRGAVPVFKYTFILL